ncbi:MAG: transglutaminase family protein [Pirellulaceae bacterium]|nr:transglutaminase family protein [Pirellulaceae bacterium]
MPRIFCLTCLVLIPMLAAGCRDATPVAGNATQRTGPRIAEVAEDRTGVVASDGATSDFDESGTITKEHWEAYYLQGHRVGYARTTVAAAQEEGVPLVRTRNASRTVLERAGQEVVQELTLTEWRRADEKGGPALVRFESSMTTGPQRIVSRGVVRDGSLVIETTTPGKTESQSIPWKAEYGGLFVVEESLAARPMQPAERRSVTGLVPIFNIVGTTQLVAADYETVKLPAGEERLLRIESTLDLGGQKLASTVWTNEKGEVLRSLVPAIGQENVRTTKEDALQKPVGGGFDLLAASVVKLPGGLADPQSLGRAVFRAKVTSGTIDGIFAEGVSQQVRRLDDTSALVTVLKVLPSEPAEVAPPTSPPTDEDLAANNLIQSEDPRIVAMAEEAADTTTDPWLTAVALEKFVARSIQKKNFSQAFATASEVAQSLEGDCTEHAVLLAALARAKKIPARVAFGLVYYPPEEGFAYHMWNEVWIGDRWVPLDGTIGRGVVAADRLKLADSSLSGGSGLAAILPVIQVFGRLELQLEEAK